MIIVTGVVAILTMIVGIVFIFLPESASKAVGIITGIIFILNGLSNIYKYLKRDGAKLYTLSIFFGILSIILGIVVLANPTYVMGFVTVCLGLYVLINGAIKINNAFWLKKGSDESWLVTLATGILLIIIGFMLVFNTFASLAVTTLSGAFLLISGILDFTDTVMFKLRSKEIMEIFW
jgi:uncharacterized membrane protein HdeD (DUF308 family)